MGDLAQRAVRSTLAVAPANLVARVVSFAGTLYLMKRLGAEPFGTVDYAASLLALCGSLGEWGLFKGAVQRQERVEETFSTFLVLRLAMMATVLAFVALGAAVLRTPLSTRTRLDALAILALGVLVDAGCEVPAARLTRALRFGRLAAIDVAGIVVSTGVGVVLALRGFGIWALVANRVGPTVVRVAGLWLLSVEPLRWGFHVEDAAWLLRFGLPLWVGGLATTWLLQYDSLIVGSLRGTQALGYYGRAYALALLPVGLVAGALTRVSFPLYARLQGDRARLSEAFRLTSGTALRVAAPLSVALAVALPDVFVVLGMRAWLPAVPLFRWLLAYALARPLMDDAGTLFTAVGRPRIAVEMLVVQALALLALCPPLTRLWGAEGAAASVGLVAVAGVAFWYARSLRKFVDIGYRRLLLWPLVSVGAAGAAGALVGASSGLPVGLAAGVAKLAATAATYAALLLLLDGRETLADLRRVYRTALRRDAQSMTNDPGNGE